MSCRATGSRKWCCHDPGLSPRAAARSAPLRRQLNTWIKDHPAWVLQLRLKLFTLSQHGSALTEFVLISALLLFTALGTGVIVREVSHVFQRASASIHRYAARTVSEAP